MDFRQFDNDGPDNIPNSADDDGYVDCLIVVFAGYAAESYWPANPGQAIWSHCWRLSEGNGPGPITVDGKKVDLYTIQSELRGTSGNRIRDIGVFCHEFGHALGLPDFYSTCPTALQPTFGSWNGPGSYCLMAYGGWGAGGNDPDRPFHLSGFAKSYLKWVTTQLVTVDLLACPIQDVHTSRTVYTNAPASYCCLVIDQTPMGFFGLLPGPYEAWIVENRQRTGFDSRLPGSGLLVYHVDGSVAMGDYDNDGVWNWGDNQTEWSETRPVLDVECADQLLADHALDTDDLSAGRNLGDARDFFYLGNSTTFGPLSRPSNASFRPMGRRLEIRNISASGPTMTADLIVGVPAGPNHDVWVRDCPRDDGTVPSDPNCDFMYYRMAAGSPDVWVDNDQDGLADAPVAGTANRLFAKVRNRGVQPADYVDVYLYDLGNWGCAPPIPIPPPPANSFWDAGKIAKLSVQGLAYMDSEVVQAWWNAPATAGPANPSTIGIVVQTATDVVGGSGSTSWENNVAVCSGRWMIHKAGRRPLSVAKAELDRRADEWPPEPAEMVIPINNPIESPLSVTVVDEQELPLGWVVEYTLEDGSVIVLPWTVLLGPMEKISLHMRSIPPAGVPEGDAGVVAVLEYRSELFPLSEGLLGSTRIPLGVDRIVPPPPLDLAGKPATNARLHSAPARKHAGVATRRAAGRRLSHYAVYRDLDPSFAPSPANLVGLAAADGIEATPEWEWFDATWTGGPEDPLPYYRMVAVDRAGNESEPTIAAYPTPVEEAALQALGRGLLIESIAPNPFGLRTVVAYVLPRGTAARLAVYDLRGRLAATLVDRVEVAGRHIVRWDGRNDRGDRLAAGIYIVRLQAAGAESTRKLVLLR